MRPLERLIWEADYDESLIPHAVIAAARDELAALRSQPVVTVELLPKEPTRVPPTFVAWRCEKCGLPHCEYWPKEGCDWCRGDAIAKRLGLTR